MNIDDNKLIFTRLFHLMPIAVGTSQCESLSSYMARLAEEHSVDLGVLIAHEIVPVLQRPYLIRMAAKGGTALYNRGWSINGTGDTAEGFARCLEELTNVRKLRALTMWPWRTVIPSRGLMREHRAWCPLCFDDWRNNEQPIYEPLLWNIMSASICGTHKIPLATRCPHRSCGMSLPILTRSLRVGHCSKCNRWLGSKGKRQKGVPVQLQRYRANMWIVQSIGDLIHRTPEIV